MSADGTSFSNPLTVPESNGTPLSTTLYARLSATAPLGAISGSISAASTNATTQTLALSGTVNVPPSLSLTAANPLALGSSIAGTAGAAATYMVSGSKLIANLVITPPTGVEIKLTTGTTYQSTPLTLTPSNGSVQTTTLDVRIAASASPGSISSSITNTSTGAIEEDVALRGTVNAPLSLGNLSQTAWTQGRSGFAGTLAITGGTASYSLVGTPSGLPTGLTAVINGSTIRFNGTPTKTGTFNGSIHIKDAAGDRATKTFTLTIN